MDEFVAPKEKVTDYRTAVSGIRAQDLNGAMPHAEAIRRVHELVGDRIIVGHSLCYDNSVRQAT